VTGWYLIFDVVTLTDILVTWPWYIYTDTCHAILITWYLTPVLAMLHLSLDIWHRYLPCYTWRLTCYHSFDMLSPGTSIFDMILWHLTGYYYTRHLYLFAYSWLSLLWGLGMIIILLPDIWYSWTLVLLNYCIPKPLEKGDSCYYTPVDPRNRITMNIGLLWTLCGHYHWTNSIIRQLTPGWGKLMSTDIISMFMMVL